MAQTYTKQEEYNNIHETDVTSLSLQLASGVPFFENLAVYIQIPSRPELYGFRYLHIIKDPINPLGLLYQAIFIPKNNEGLCPHSLLEKAIRDMLLFQNDAAQDPDTADKVAEVGVAKWTGKKYVSWEELVDITVAKYYTMRRDWIGSKNLGSDSMNTSRTPVAQFASSHQFQ